MSHKLKQRDEIEAFINKGGGITLLQKNDYGEESIICFEHEDVEKICEMLEAVKQEALDFVPDSEYEEHEENQRA